MSIIFEQTTINGLFVIHPHVFIDNRGYFIKDFEKASFEKYNLPTVFCECNESKSKKGTIRGLHFQQKHSQGKLIRVIQGAVYDVAVDLRFGSPTFGKWEGFELSEYNHLSIYIPEGFAHGFLSLEDDSIFSYKCTDVYSPQYDSGIRFDDKDINIKWPVEQIGGWRNIITSAKDMKLQSLRDFIKRGEMIE